MMQSSISDGALSYRPTVHPPISSWLPRSLCKKERTRRSQTSARPWLPIPTWALPTSGLPPSSPTVTKSTKRSFIFAAQIEIDPDVPAAYCDVAHLLRRQGNLTEAAKYDAKGEMVSSRQAEVQRLRGTELVRQGKLDQAIALFQTAISLAPDSALAHNNLADALALQGNINEALSHYRRALAIDPAFAPAKHGLEQLSNR